MSLAFGGSGGGAGGGRGFSYRSSHQQGHDGPNNNNNRGPQRRRPRSHGNNNNKHNKNKLKYAADIFVPHHLRSVLIGKGGATIQSLIKDVSRSCSSTSSNSVSISVPPRRRPAGAHQTPSNSSNNDGFNNIANEEDDDDDDDDDNRPVRVKADTVASLLHACWRILHVLVVNNASSSSSKRQRETRGTGDDDAVMVTTMTSMACHVRIPSNGPCLMGRLASTSPFFFMAATAGDQAPPSQHNVDDSRRDDRPNSRSQSGDTTTMLSVYCVQSFLDAQQVDTVVDNVRFANAAVTAQYETVYQDACNDAQNDDNDDGHEHDHHAHENRQPSSLLFAYGTAEQQPELLYEALRHATTQLWQQEQQQQLLLEQQQQQPSTQHPYQYDDDKEEESPFTVGTYNLLHPVYAERYHEAAGVDRILLSSNWLSFRVATIYRILLASRLDIFLLQEVDAQAFSPSNSSNNDNHPHHHGNLLKEQLLELYEFIHFVHPARSANDSVAVLIRKDRFVVLQQESVPFIAKKGNRDADDKDTSSAVQQEPELEPQHYMCAAIVLVKDLKTQRRYRVASTHFCPSKSQHPEQTLMEFLAKRSKMDTEKDDCNIHHSCDSSDSDCDAIIWGGDCNNEYKSPIRNAPLFSAYTTIQDANFHGKVKDELDNETTQQEPTQAEQQQSSGPRPCDQKPLTLQQRRRRTRGSKCIDWIFFSTPNNNSNNGSNTKSRGRLHGCRSSISEAFVHATARRLEPTGYPASDHLGEAVTLVYKDGPIF
jgi:hypothetical protein